MNQRRMRVVIISLLWIVGLFRGHAKIESKNNSAITTNEQRSLKIQNYLPIAKTFSNQNIEEIDNLSHTLKEKTFLRKKQDPPQLLYQKSSKKKIESAGSKYKEKHAPSIWNPFAVKGVGHAPPHKTNLFKGTQLAKSDDSLWKTTPLVDKEGKQLNLLYVKVSKVGSSTVGGIIRRIAHHHGISGWNTNLAKEQFSENPASGDKPKIEEPAVYANHGHMESEEDILSTLRLPFHLITWVRDPVDRCLSSYYHFALSRHTESTVHPQAIHRVLKKESDSDDEDDDNDEKNTETNPDARKLHYMASHTCQNFQFNYIATKKMKSLAINPEDNEDGLNKPQKPSAKSKIGLPGTVIDDVLKEVFKTYDFIGSTSKFDESTLLLAWQLNLTMCDVLYLKSKDSSDGRKDDRTNHFVVPHPPLQNESAVVQAYARSTEFRVANQLDYELVDAVEMKLKNLQMRVTQRNEALFNHVLARYKYYLQLAKEQCYPHNNSVANLKELTECYWNDNGCGYPCLNEVCRSHPELMQKLSLFTLH